MVGRGSLSVILPEYRERVLRLALSISRNEKDAEDILQNTFLKIYRNIAQFKGRSKISTWIYRIAYNEALLLLRKKRRLFKSQEAYKDYFVRLPDGFMVNWSQLPDRMLLDRELKERVQAALQGLPIQYRMPLLLHRMEGLSLVQCARVLGINASTVKTRLHRAYLAVKQELERYYHDLPAPMAAQEARCGVWAQFVYAYAQDTLPASRKSSFDRHIAHCPRCHAFLDSYQQAIRITGALACRDIPASLKEKIDSFVVSKIS